MYLYRSVPHLTWRRIGLLIVLTLGSHVCVAQQPPPQPDWPNLEGEILRHFQGLIRLDTTNPPGNETRAVEYIKRVLEAEKIPFEIFAHREGRANLVARILGNGSK